MCDQHYSFDLQPDIKSQRPKHTICGVDLFGVIVYYNRMFHMTTVSLIARVDMQDAMQGFIHNKSFPELSMSLCGQHTEHRFEENHEQHRFTITASLDTGPHAGVPVQIDHTGCRRGDGPGGTGHTHGHEDLPGRVHGLWLRTDISRSRLHGVARPLEIHSARPHGTEKHRCRTTVAHTHGRCGITTWTPHI